MGRAKSRYKGGVSDPKHPLHLEYRKKMHLRAKCVDCKKPITETAMRCHVCFGKHYRGDKAFAWKGGTSTKNELIRNRNSMRLWREAVFARDNWTCQKCGERGGRIEAHHVKRFSKYPELRLAIDNGLTLCKSCHKKVGSHGRMKKNG